MRPLHKAIEIEDNDNNCRMVEYEVEYEIHPEYKDLTMKELKKLVNFSEGETVPDIVVVNILTNMENFDIASVKDAIKSEEEVTNDDDIQFVE